MKCLAHYPATCTGCPSCEAIVASAERRFAPTPKRAGDLVMIGSGAAATWQRVSTQEKGRVMGEQVAGVGEFSIGGVLWPGLSKLIEECGEVMQVAGKLIGSEGRTDHWSGDLNTALIEELGDLAAAMEFFLFTNDLDHAAIGARRERKLDLFEKWHRDTLAARATGVPEDAR